MELVLPCFAHTDTPGELWPMLLEKAWAKLHSSYSVTRQGSALVALSYLTGRPIQKIDHCFLPKDEELWHLMQTAGNRDCIITAQLYEREKESTKDSGR